MCIVVYFGYAPPPKTGSARETGSSGMRGSERLGDFFGISVRKAAVTEHQAAASACFAAKGRCLESRLAPAGRPGPGPSPGRSLACSRDFRQSAVVSQCLEADGTQNPAVKEEQ